MQEDSKAVVDEVENTTLAGPQMPASSSVAKRSNVSRRGLLGWLGAALFATPPLAFVANTLLGVHAPEASAQAAAPATGRLRRWSMVIDLRYCDGCQSVDKPPQCTEACIQAHFASQPMEWIQVYEDDLPGGGTRFVPTPCQQCQNPPCTNVCPVAATFTTPEGVVLIDQQRCFGCRICMAACPYDRRFFNWGKPPQPPEAQLKIYDIEEQSPALRGTVMKCDFCPDMARAGRLVHCAQACPNHAIYYGDLEEDLATNGRNVIRMTRFLSDNSAVRLKEELGTEPRVYYVPGHGEAVGRSAFTKGRKATTWPWQEVAKGSEKWTR
jgi:molybdopterin-containing oxidoreductase family iron-sulfur binding subunit